MVNYCEVVIEKKKNTKEILCEIYGQCMNLGTLRQQLISAMNNAVCKEQCKLAGGWKRAELMRVPLFY